MKPGSDMPCACANSLTDWLPLPSSSSTARRVESDKAANRSSRAASEY